MLVTVKGGTNAGRRIIRKPAQSWTHTCSKRDWSGVITMDACFSRCPDCGCKRP